jgi:hypothetical protein
MENERQRKLGDGLSSLTFTISLTKNQWMLQAMLLLQENIPSMFQNTLTRKTLFFETVMVTGQLLVRENTKRYSSHYLKTLFGAALQNKPTLFKKKIWPRYDIICKYTSAINFRRILRESVVFQQVVSFNVNVSPLIFNSAGHNI